MYGEDGVIDMNNQMNNDIEKLNETQVMPQMGVVSGGASQNSSDMIRQVRTGVSVSGIDKATIRALPKKVAGDPKYTENWINIKTISNGIIYNKQGMMVTGVKIQPKNIFILDQSQMDNTLIGLMNFYNTLDFEFWIIVADRPVDISMYQAELQLLFNKTQDQMLRKIIQQDMDKGDFFTNNNVVDTEYYILFKENKMDMLQKKVRSMINNLASAGLVASQTTTEDLRMVVDNFLNAGRTFRSGGVMPQ